MGSSHSAGRDNDELVDVLKTENYIKSEKVENVFRTVDRGDYIDGFIASQLYADQTLRHASSFLHLSAPCIYASVVEALDISFGHSFLNVGSGTGYLSTVVGNLLGPNSINHGIELRQTVVEHAYRCLEKYITTCIMFDATVLAVPTFSCGNGLDLDTDYRKYDRIYVGAEVPEEYKHVFCSLLIDDGKLVMPYMGKLVCITREGERLSAEELLSVSFSPLMTKEMVALEKEDEPDGEEMMETWDVSEDKNSEPVRIEARLRSLQALCRLQIYKLIGRENLERVVDLPINVELQKYIVYYRETTLPSIRERPVYATPTEEPTARNEPNAGLNFIGQYLDFMQQFNEDRQNSDEDDG